MEKQLVNKTYYEMFMKENESRHPIDVLGELNQAKATDETALRFAQGEVYFYYKDFETAIFKWEKVKNELEPWAKRNMADAYFELGFLQQAEEMYTAINTDNVTLTIEVALQLFSLYLKQGRTDAAFQVVKKCVSLDPDYPNVTKIARAFYEGQQDYKSALDLAVQEAIRKQSQNWFDLVKTYIDKGYTSTTTPEYFIDILMTLYPVDQSRFEEMVSALWVSYKKGSLFLSWLQVFDHLFTQIETNSMDSWVELSGHYQETYIDLMQGNYFISELSAVIPAFLSNWLKITDAKQGLFTSSAILAWSEIFPASISQTVLNDAESLICQAENDINCLQDSFYLLEAILEWAHKNDLTLGNRSKWWVQKLTDTSVHHVLVAGTVGSGKSTFINSILGENMLRPATSTAVMFKDGAELDIKEISERDVRTISTYADFDQITTGSRYIDKEESWIDFTMPCDFLQHHAIALIDTPEMKGTNNDEKEVFRYLDLADSLLFVLDQPFTDREATLLLRIHDEAPNLPIHFVIDKTVYPIQTARIAEFFPDANVLSYSADNNSRELAHFFAVNFGLEHIEDERISKLLLLIRKTIMNLFEKRLEVENGLANSINWNEEMAEKLNGATHQLKDLEKEKIQIITKSYQAAKDEVYQDITTNIPELLKECAELVNEESDFRQIHHTLNEEMNRRIRNYLQTTVLPKFYQSIEAWIILSENELQQSSAFLAEISESFNALYEMDRIQFMCDFKVLEDWQRDADRMTSRVHIETMNILHRFTPAQVLLKSAGKLFGAFSQNKTMLSNKYKKYLESEDFGGVAKLIAEKFLIQFELFESGLERDISLFFRNPYQVLKHTIEETHTEIHENQDTLSKMKENPEIYQDPLNIFEVRLRQFELINNVKQKHSPYPYYDVRS